MINSAATPAHEVACHEASTVEHVMRVNFGMCLDQCTDCLTLCTLLHKPGDTAHGAIPQCIHAERAATYEQPGETPAAALVPGQLRPSIAYRTLLTDTQHGWMQTGHSCHKRRSHSMKSSWHTSTRSVPFWRLMGTQSSMNCCSCYRRCAPKPKHTHTVSL